MAESIEVSTACNRGGETCLSSCLCCLCLPQYSGGWCTTAVCVVWCVCVAVCIAVTGLVRACWLCSLFRFVLALIVNTSYSHYCSDWTS